MNNKQNTNFLGTGWAFPPAFEQGTKSVQMVSKEEDIKQSLQILLSTTLGERFLQPTYGCNLHDFLFETINESMKSYLEELVRTAILFHEPRIKLDEINVLVKATEGLMLFEIFYWIITTNTRSNFVYPFYLNEGTDILQ